MNIKIYKKVNYYILLFLLVSFFSLAYLDNRFQTLLCLYLFFILWGVDKVFAYYLGEKISLAYGVSVPADANIGWRLLGVTFPVMISIYGVVELFLHIAT